jgi:hypothetical protein
VTFGAEILRPPRAADALARRARSTCYRGLGVHTGNVEVLLLYTGSKHGDG